MADGSALVPCANRGLKSPQGVAAIVDYVTLSAKVAAIPSVRGSSFTEAVWHHFFSGCPLRLDATPRGWKNAYEAHFRILTPDDQVCGFIAWGGNNGTVCVDLTGAGCAYVADWEQWARACEAVDARLTRVDLAHDDFAGLHSIDHTMAMYRGGAFTRGGRPPDAKHIDDMGSNKGRTFYVGENNGNQRLCAYEKGKQLGDPQSPWVRFEGRFGAKYRAIPHDVFRRPAEFLAGMFPALAWISALQDKFATAAKKVAASAKSLAFHLRRQYGRLIGVAQSALTEGDQFVDWVRTLSRPGLPAKLKVPHAAKVIGDADIWRIELCVS